MIDIRVGYKYRLGRKLGSGAFGDIYLGLNIQSNEEVAIKLEKTNKKTNQLQYESRVLKSLQCSQGVPIIYWYGIEGSFNSMVMELLGPTLDDLFSFSSRRFSLKTVLMIADQLLSRLETVHLKNFIHRDIKPGNFLIGIGKKSNIIYIVDFGLAKQYRDPKTHKHIAYADGKSLIGTTRYASVNNHMGIELSRRDDLESLAYVLLYLLTGCLPWQGKTFLDREDKSRMVRDFKVNTPIEQLFQDVPSEFMAFLGYCRGLKFDDRPDYAYLKKIFNDLFSKQMFEYDNIYDWTILNYVKPLKLNEFYLEQRSVFYQEENKEADVEPAHRNTSLEQVALKRKKCIVF